MTGSLWQDGDTSFGREVVISSTSESRMISLANFTAKSTEIQNKIGDLYSVFAKRFADDPEVAKLFLDMGEDEYQHAKSFEFVERILRNYQGKIEIDPKFFTRAESIISSLDRARNMMSEGKVIDVDTALTVATNIESAVIEKHIFGLITTEDEKVSKLLMGLNFNYENHRNKVASFKEKRRTGIDPANGKATPHERSG